MFGNEVICLDCGLNNLRLAVQQMIREVGLEQTQIFWEREKTKMSNKLGEVLVELERTDPEMARLAKDNGDKVIETIEGDLYPDRRKGDGSG